MICGYGTYETLLACKLRDQTADHTSFFRPRHRFTAVSPDGRNLKLYVFSGSGSHLRSSSLGWFLLSRLRSMRSESRCFRTSVAYSSLLCSTVMMREATLPRSLMEKPRWASRVRMKHSRKTLLLMSWPKSFSPFSTCSCRATRDSRLSICICSLFSVRSLSRDLRL
ncbi:hypothetical protein EYF80_024611 [Liparis tanakae]|uniref:Uncharacterized protein n=1 Tax=Liparis tanakae TaxID=230148 RepID=A0A4Z2HJV6_9TELE|nr:hypothetical protein EYF80_024611 [Liparis tanakae]